MSIKRTQTAAAYLRVSTDAQAGEDRFGLPDQKATIRAFAKRQGWEVTAWYVDEGFSGGSLERPQLQRLLNDARSRSFQAVIVAKLDRLARDLMAQLWLEKELLKHEVEVLSVAEPFRGQDPANVLFRQIIGAFAQFEKARITERLRGGRLLKAKTGGYAGGRPPIGYAAGMGSKTLTVDQAKAETVKRVFQLRKAHPRWSLQELADRLNAEGHTTATGTPFLRMQVKRILERRPLYSGQYRYGTVKTRGKHLAILKQSRAS